MCVVAEGLIDHYTGSAIKEKITDDRSSGRATGSGEFGADLWVEAMVSARLFVVLVFAFVPCV